MNDPFGIGLDCTPQFRPNMISKDHMPLLFKDVPESVKVYARTLRDKGWNFYSVSQRRGACYYKEKVITIPVWAIDRELGKKVQYIAHEMAHAYCLINRCDDVHGPNFMKQMMEICPQEYWHFELEYKPRNAKAAGIADPNKKKDIDIFDLGL